MHKIKHVFTFIILTALLSACGGGGSSSTPPPANTAPNANAGTDISTLSAWLVSLNGSASSDSDGSVASYAWTQTSGTTVSLSTPNAAMSGFTAPTVTVDTTLSFQLQVTDNDGAVDTDTVTVLIASTPVILSGSATYDNIPHTSGSGLDYNNMSQDPIRGAVVEAIYNTSSILASGQTDLFGNYSFEVPPNVANVFIRIKAHALLNDTASWDARVVDNTNTQAIYALDGTNFAIGTTNITRPTMNAGSGWNGSSYSGVRAAAPFHILDRVMDGHLKLQEVDPDVVLPSVDINWSPNNSPTFGTTGDDLLDLRNGDIGTSFYTTLPTGFEEFSGPQLFILGTENTDTDEYDGHVIVHEWGHYFEANLSRSDSIGGNHGRRDRLDMRVAFGEGFGNAWSAMITDDPFYRDSFELQQSQGFEIDIEDNAVTNPGWYSEGSVQSVLYDIYDVANDNADTLSLGLGPIYEVLTGPQRTTEAFTSIFSFSKYFRDNNSASVSAYNGILNAQSIFGTDIWGLGETNNAGNISNVLPVYTELFINDTSKVICSIDDFDTQGNGNDFTADSGNDLSNFRFIRFTITSAGNYDFLISAGATQDPDMEIYSRGTLIAFAAPDGDGVPGDSTNSRIALTAGTYSAVLYEYDNTLFGNTANSNDECFQIQIQSAP